MGKFNITVIYWGGTKNFNKKEGKNRTFQKRQHRIYGSMLHIIYLRTKQVDQWVICSLGVVIFCLEIRLISRRGVKSLKGENSTCYSTLCLCHLGTNVLLS